MSNEKTDELKKKKSRWWIWVILILVLAAAAYFGYTFFTKYQKEQKIKEQLEAGTKALNEGKYDEGKTAFNAVLEEDPVSLEATEGLSSCCLLTEDWDGAQNAYKKLYSQTKDEKYNRIAESVTKGNTSGNATNGGYTAVQGLKSYFVESNNSVCNIFDISSGTPEKAGTVEYQSIAPHSLNIWGNSLYYIKDKQIYSYNLGTNQEAAVTSNEAHNYEFLIVNKGRIFAYRTMVSSTMVYNPNASSDGNAIVSMKLDGSEDINLYPSDPASQLVYVTEFIFSNDDKYIYIVRANPNGSKSTLMRFSFDLEVGGIYTCDTGIIRNLQEYDGFLYWDENKMDSFNMTISNGDYIVKFDKDHYEATTAFEPGNVSSLNISDGQFYYVSNDTIYVSDESGKDPVSIGKPEVGTEYGTRNYLGLGGLGIFDSTSVGQNGQVSYISSFNLNEPYDLQKFEPASDSESAN